jgi:ATP-dependent RNA helicase RhlE
MSSNAPRQTGTVQWYNQRRGFGFVTPDSDSDDVFVHRTSLPNHLEKNLDAGHRIAFEIKSSRKGPLAMNVTPLNEAPPAVVIEPVTDSHFTELGLQPALLRAVQDAGYVTPTSIQHQAIPHLLAGRDLLGCAQTGTGKTAAFALPVLQHLANAANHHHSSNGNHKGHPKRPIRALVLAPTRELAMQIGDSFTTYGKYTGLSNTVICGGVGQNPQVKTLRRGVDILIATPGRLLDLIGQGHVKLNQVEMLVLDEADRMLDMGFIHDVRRILKHIPDQRQTLLFSATLPHEILELGGQILRDPLHIAVAPEQPTVEAIEQGVYFVRKKKKQALLEHLLADPEVSRALVFTRTKHGANRVVRNLQRAGIEAEPIHGNKSQTARQQALKKFRSGKTWVLVATDVVSRGIDVDDISHVIQFDLPNEPETYVHRIGRTGRAGASGVALAFCADNERSYLKGIEKLIHMRVPVVGDHPYRA